MINFNDYKKCLLNGEIILKSQQRFISKKHDVYTENINKIALSNNDDKRIVSSNKITSYPYGYVLKHYAVSYKGKILMMIIITSKKIFKGIGGNNSLNV